MPAERQRGCCLRVCGRAVKGWWRSEAGRPSTCACHRPGACAGARSSDTCVFILSAESNVNPVRHKYMLHLRKWLASFRAIPSMTKYVASCRELAAELSCLARRERQFQVIPYSPALSLRTCEVGRKLHKRRSRRDHAGGLGVEEDSRLSQDQRKVKYGTSGACCAAMQARECCSTQCVAPLSNTITGL